MILTNKSRADSSLILSRSESCNSITSCLDVTEQREKKHEQPSKKSVRFSPIENNETFSRYFQFSTLPANELWYTPVEFEAFKTAFKADAKTVAKSAKDSGESTAMNRLFSGAAASEEDEELVQQFLQNPEHAGMYRMSSRAIFNDKTTRRKKLVSLVKQIQDMECDSNDNKALFLAMACEKISRPSTDFVHKIAKIAVV